MFEVTRGSIQEGRKRASGPAAQACCMSTNQWTGEGAASSAALPWHAAVCAAHPRRVGVASRHATRDTARRGAAPRGWASTYRTGRAVSRCGAAAAVAGVGWDGRRAAAAAFRGWTGRQTHRAHGFPGASHGHGSPAARGMGCGIQRRIRGLWNRRDGHVWFRALAMP